MKKSVLLFTIIFLLVSKLFAQSLDTVMKRSPVRTLTNQQYTAYLNGTDLNNRAYVAQFNHYPLPDLILKYKKELDLSPVQISGLTAEVKTLVMKKKEIGLSVIKNERMLDTLFRTKKIDEGTVIFYGNRYGLYESEYRTALLQACYKTQKLLTERQIKKFEMLQKHNN